MSGACVVEWQSFTKAGAQKFPMGGKNRPKSGTGGIRAAHTIAYTAQMRFTALQLDDAYRWRCQQRKHFPSDADIWHLRFRYPFVKHTLLYQNPAPDVFVAKALSRISLKRHNGAMQLQLIRNIWEPTELVRFLVTANIVLYITSLFIAPGAVNYDLNPMVFLSPSTGVLFKLGASGTLPVFAEDRWWTLITANYLHGSLLHLLFNVFALRAVGKINIEIYAPSRFFLIYFLGGLFSMAISSLAGIPLTLGASGAVCALIGSMSYDEWRASKGNLKMRIASVGTWVALIAITGLALPNVNNWAHAVGFVSGFLLGFLFWSHTTQSESKTFRVAATSCMLLTIGALIYGLLFS